MTIPTSWNDSTPGQPGQPAEPAGEPSPVYPPPGQAYQQPLPVYPPQGPAYPPPEPAYSQSFGQPLPTNPPPGQTYPPPGPVPQQPFGQPLPTYPPLGQAYPPPGQPFTQPMNYQQHPGFAPPPPPTPKKQLRRDIMVVVVVLLGIFAIQIVLVATATVGVVFTSPEFIGTMQEVANSSVYDQQEIIDNTDFEQMAANINYDFLMVAMLIAALLTLPMLMIIRGKRALTTDLVAVNQKARPLSIFKTLLLMLGIGAAANLLAMAVAPLLDLADLSLTDYMEDSISGMLTSPVGLLYVALLGPIIEEIIFRGAILNRLSRHGINFAIVTQALMFGLFHGILFQSFYAFFMGLILGYVAVRYSLKWAMVLHIANNSISVGFSLLDQAGIGPVVDYLMIAYLIVFFVGAVVLLIVKRKQFSVIRQHGLPVTPEPYRIAFSSPFLIIFIAIYLGMGVYTLFLPLFL